MMRLPGSPAPSGPTYKPRYPNTPGPRPGSLGGLGGPRLGPGMPAPTIAPNPGLQAPMQPIDQGPVMMPATPQARMAGPALPVAPPQQPIDQGPVMLPATPQARMGAPGRMPVGAAEPMNPGTALNRRAGMMGLALRRQAV